MIALIPARLSSSGIRRVVTLSISAETAVAAANAFDAIKSAHAAIERRVIIADRSFRWTGEIRRRELQSAARIGTVASSLGE
jgi:hypothetical protein